MITNLDLTTYDIPHEVLEAAKTVTEWATRHGVKDWELMGIADRNLVTKLKTALRTFLA